MAGPWKGKMQVSLNLSVNGTFQPGFSPPFDLRQQLLFSKVILCEPPFNAREVPELDLWGLLVKILQYQEM